MNVNQKSNAETIETDVVIVGGGGAGFAAAASASERGAKVILLEKRGVTGGTSVFAHGLCAVESHVHKRLNIDIRKDDIFTIAMDYSHWSIDPRIFRAFIEKSGDTIRWLEGKGLVFENIYNMTPDIDAPTFHIPASNEKAGPVIIRALREHCEKQGVRVVLNCPAKRIITGEKGGVAGVTVSMEGKEIVIKTGSVIITSGGYTGNKELLKKHYPLYSDNIAFLGVPNTGDGLLMAMEAGAATEGLGMLLLHPQYYKGPASVNSMIQEPSTIWINKRGERFTDETVTFRASECGNAVNRQLDKCNIVLFDRGVLNRVQEQGFLRGAIFGQQEESGASLDNLQDIFGAETGKGDLIISDTLEGVSKWMGISPAVLNETVSEYNRSCEKGYDEVFNKDPKYLHSLKTPPYYAVRSYVSCLDTLGGIKINQHMEVLDRKNDPIPGLYAGGDVAGGWESHTYCIKIPGSTFGFAINSGRIAGENAAKYIAEL